LGGAPGPRFVALDVKETKAPLVATDGFALGPFEGAMMPLAAVPFVEMRNVVGVHVLEMTPPHVFRKNTWGVTPSNVTFETKFVALDTKTTNCPSELMAGLKLSPSPSLNPSADMDTSCAAFPLPVHVVAPPQVGRQNIWEWPFVWTAEVMRFVAVEVNAASAPALSIEGSELAPLAELPFGSELIRVVVGAQVADAKQVLRK
jgi:hypothetical protein